MPNKSIKTILMERDGMTEQEAERLIQSARNDAYQRLENGEQPYYICEEYFGLEPDYLEELLF